MCIAVGKIIIQLLYLEMISGIPMLVQAQVL